MHGLPSRHRWATGPKTFSYPLLESCRFSVSTALRRMSFHRPFDLRAMSAACRMDRSVGVQRVRSAAGKIHPPYLHRPSAAPMGAVGSGFFRSHAPRHPRIEIFLRPLTGVVSGGSVFSAFSHRAVGGFRPHPSRSRWVSLGKGNGAIINLSCWPKRFPLKPDIPCDFKEPDSIPRDDIPSRFDPRRTKAKC